MSTLRFTAGVGVGFSGACGLPMVLRARKPLTKCGISNHRHFFNISFTRTILGTQGVQDTAPTRKGSPPTSFSPALGDTSAELRLCCVGLNSQPPFAPLFIRTRRTRGPKADARRQRHEIRNLLLPAWQELRSDASPPGSMAPECAEGRAAWHVPSWARLRCIGGSLRRVQALLLASSVQRCTRVANMPKNQCAQSSQAR